MLSQDHAKESQREGLERLAREFEAARGEDTRVARSSVEERVTARTALLIAERRFSRALYAYRSGFRFGPYMYAVDRYGELLRHRHEPLDHNAMKRRHNNDQRLSRGAE